LLLRAAVKPLPAPDGYNPSMHETFEHTADLGLRVRAASEEELFAEAALGLFSMIVPDLNTVQPTQARQFTIVGRDRDYLLFDWLNELLYVFDTERLLLSQFDVRLSDQGLAATARGESYDPQRHRLDHEVKAITYHGLRVEHDGDGWLAEVIVDI
jgi:SHS2 domain-containing protein